MLCLLIGRCGKHRFYLGDYTWDDVLELTPVFLRQLCNNSRHTGRHVITFSRFKKRDIECVDWLLYTCCSRASNMGTHRPFQDLYGIVKTQNRKILLSPATFCLISLY
jgi:hypothetical protein